MALRELANTRTRLTGADRAAAEALLKRPTSAGGDGTLNYGSVKEAPPSCTPDLCVHYVRSGKHAPALRDANGNGVPDYVDLARTTLTDVHDTYVRAGYREPKPDGTRGGNAKIDVYIGDIGDQGVYGYCTSDEPEPDPTPSSFDRWAYCVLDEDYSEFPTNTPKENLQVTAAHEYFHATQFAYDRYEDAWLLEATATWAEDELYDGVDDNVQYLRVSQMARPRVPLDTFDQSGIQYGTWSFFRLLTEKYTKARGGLPTLVLDVWRKADGRRGAPDLWSWQAVDRVLKARGTTGAAQLAAYGAANRRSQAVYDEGRANRYPTAPLGARRTLTTSSRVLSTSVRLRHLTTWTARVQPAASAPKDWRLRVAVDLGPRNRGQVALVTVYPRNGAARVMKVGLGPAGVGSKVLAFGPGQTKAVEVTVSNGSGRFRCWTGDPYSCSGTPLDDNVLEKVTLTAFR
jgi:hypothetical protein